MHSDLLAKLLNQRWIVFLDHLRHFQQSRLHLLVLYFRKFVAILDMLLHSLVIFKCKRTIQKVQRFIAQELVEQENGAVVLHYL